MTRAFKKWSAILIVVLVGAASQLDAASPESLTDSITRVLRQFFTALVDRDRPAIEKVILPHEQSTVLLSGPHPLTGKDAAAAKAAIEQLTCRLLQPGESFTTRRGRKLGITALMVNESNQVASVTMAGEVLPSPLRFVRTNGQWRLDSQVFIAAALKAMKPSERPTPKL